MKNAIMKKSNKKIKRKLSSQKNKKNICASNAKAEGHRANAIESLIAEAQYYRDNKQLEQASFLYQKILQLESNNIVALNGLGIIAMDAGMLSLSVDFFNSAYKVNPDHITVNKNLGLAYTKLSYYDEAMLHYSRMLELDNNNSEVHGELARLYLQVGNMKLALDHYKLAFYLCPDDPRNFHGLVQLDIKSITPDIINKIEKILLKPDLSLEVRSSFYFALGTLYDGLGKYDEAFANYSVANISKGMKFNQTEHEDYITGLIDTFTPELFEKYSSCDLNSSEQPVFIVGMPRSGTTLVEQILATHTDIYAAGELNFISNIAEKINMSQEPELVQLASLENSNVDVLKNLSRFYINDINNIALNDARRNPLRITDKLPMNFMYLGLIALLFPNAHIIHCRRNPLDVSLSCYFQNFSANHAYASDLENIAVYYQQYERLMSYWTKVLPLTIHTVDYEAMVSDTESTSKKIIEYLGLDWQGNCANFYKTNRHVNTASLVQVRKKIYRTSIDRWQHYDKYLHILKNKFDVLDYVNDANNIAIVNSKKNIKYREESRAYLH